MNSTNYLFIKAPQYFSSALVVVAGFLQQMQVSVGFVVESVTEAGYFYPCTSAYRCRTHTSSSVKCAIGPTSQHVTTASVRIWA